MTPSNARPLAFATHVGLLAVTLLVSAPPTAVEAEESDPAKLAREAKTLLKTHCYRCHGVEKEVPEFDVSDVAGMQRNRSDEPSFLVAGNPEESLLWQRAGIDGDMPPEKVKLRPSETELATLRKWIEAGAPPATEATRTHVSEQAVLRLIRNDLQRQGRADRRHLRYLSMHNAANNPRFDQADLRMFRAALSKLLNSLARSSRLTMPAAVSDGQSDSTTDDLVYRIDLRDFGWTTAQWQNAISGYSYGLIFNDPDLDELTDDIEELVGPVSSDGIPYIRIDWFVATASAPPVYHELANIPDTAQELEQRLGIDVQRDFLQDRLQRAGFSSSGVSRHNRLIDRHIGSQTAYYYKSYDFSKSFGRSLIARFPLGPRFDNNTFADDFGFDHDGGEIIYSLPNGMQAYMLIDTVGKRIDRGPISIVRDLRETAGTPEIVNGISCMGCHRHGMLDYTNAIDSELTLTGKGRAKAQRLYTENERMKSLVNEDRQRFVNALQQVVGPYLQAGEDKEKDIRSFAEPIRVVVGWYNRDITIADAAADLNIKDAKDLAASIRSNNDLLGMGLGPLAVNQTLPRRMWDTLEESSASVYQRAALAVRIGSGIALSGN